MKNMRVLVLPILLVLALVLAACGAEEDPTPEPQPTEEPTSQDDESMDDEAMDDEAMGQLEGGEPVADQHLCPSGDDAPGFACRPLGGLTREIGAGSRAQFGEVSHTIGILILAFCQT